MSETRNPANKRAYRSPPDDISRVCVAENEGKNFCRKYAESDHVALGSAVKEV